MEPVVSTSSGLVARRLRWALAFLSSSAVLGVGTFLWGGFDTLGIFLLAWAVRIIAALLSILGLAVCLSALVASIAEKGKKRALVVGIGLAGIVVIVGTVLVAPLTGILVAPAILTLVIILSIVPKNLPGEREVRQGRKLLLAVSFALLTLAIVVVGVLQITVWDPLAKLPGMTLDEIYSAMAAAQQPTGAIGIALWASFWALGALLLPVAASMRRFSGLMTTRRMIAAGLLLVGATASTHWFAAFAMGMNLADTFETSGGDANMIDILLNIVGHTTLAAGLLLGLSPEPFIAKRLAAAWHEQLQA